MGNDSTTIIDHRPVQFIDPIEAYFASRPLDIPDAPYDIRIARDEDGRIIASYGSPFENYCAWMELALECHLWRLASELVVEMTAAEGIVASNAETFEHRAAVERGCASSRSARHSSPAIARAVLDDKE